ncbi:MAG: DUF4352 domain-containing protein [Thermomicrobiales bacterium]
MRRRTHVDRARQAAVVLLVLALGGVVAGGFGSASAAPGANWSRVVVRAVGEDRTDPAPIGEAIEAGPWRLTALEVVTGQDATDRVTAASELNEPPGGGFAYVLVNVRAENTADRALAIDGNDFAITGASGNVWRFVIATPPDPALDGAVEPGGSIEGWLVFEAPADETSLLLVYDSVTLTGNWADRVFALEDGATVADADQPAVEPNDAGSEAASPAGFNAPVATDEWAIELLQLARGQEVFDLVDFRLGALGNADPGGIGRWIAFRFRVTSNLTGGEPAHLSPTAFTLADADGNPVLDVLTLTPPNPDAAGAYYPGASRDGWVALELPIDWGGTLLRFLPYQTDDDPRYFTWGEGAPQAEPPRQTVPIEEGATVRTTDELNLRAEPSTDAAIVTTLEAGAELRITGPGEEGGDFTWYPVEYIETGETGFVAGDFLEPVDG